jgi:hypothetical protein
MRSKKPTATPTVFVDIEAVHGRLQQWRRDRKHGERIPEELWMAAVKLTKRYRPARIAHTLGLDYAGLKQRLKAAKQDDRSASQPGFIELLPLTPSSLCQCTMEIEDRRGAKMKLEFQAVSAGDVAAVSRALWSVER